MSTDEAAILYTLHSSTSVIAYGTEFGMAFFFIFSSRNYWTTLFFGSVPPYYKFNSLLIYIFIECFLEKVRTLVGTFKP